MRASKPKPARRPHPCRTWCEGELRGIVERNNRTRRDGLRMEVEITSVRSGPTDWDAGVVTMACPHKRLYLLRVIRIAEARDDTDG